MKKRKFWTPEELELLQYCYEDTATAELAELLDRDLMAVYRMAHKLGLRKNAEFMASESSGRIRRPGHGSIPHRFKPGHIPANKGLRRPGWVAGRMAETQFKPGQRPGNWLPVGSTRINADGYLDLKITDTGYPPRDWVGAHIMLWEDAHGPVPPGHAVVFKDGDKGNVEIENLEMVSRAELMRRNTIHNLPKDLVEVIQLNGVLKRKLRTLECRREKQDV